VTDIQSAENIVFDDGNGNGDNNNGNDNNDLNNGESSNNAAAQEIGQSQGLDQAA
jgi:hypothetical protein